MAMNKIGALWLKESKKEDENGKKMKFMSGVLESNGKKTEIVVFKNKNKTTDKHPDYEMYLSEKRGQKAEQPKSNMDIPF